VNGKIAPKSIVIGVAEPCPAKGKAESQPAPSGIDRTWRATVAIATGGAPHHEDAQAGTIGYFFLCKFSVTVWSRGKCAWSNCGGDSAIHWLSERSAK
jgi:hypothetical protein